MIAKIVHFPQGVTILAGGKVGRRALEVARARAPYLVAADGGMRHVARAGLGADVLIGDMDSCRGAVPAATRIVRIAEQDSTDFEKCVYTLEAPFMLALGVTGSRTDHGLAAFNVLARYPDKRVFILAGKDIVFLAPPEITLELRAQTRVSLFPLAPVRGTSEGLEWPIDGAGFSPLGRIGVSNRAVSGRVRLTFDARHMLVILPRRETDAVLRAFDLLA